jgi:antirestriction protein ArdC
MRRSRKDKIEFYQLVYLELADSFLRAQEYIKLKASLSRSERKRVENNFSKIAEIAATNLVDNYMIDDNPNLSDEQIIEAFSLATLVYLGNG